MTELRVSLPDELYWRLGRLKYSFKTRSWREFLAKMCDIVEDKMKPIYVDEMDMTCMVLALAVWRSLEDFDAGDWEKLSNPRLLYKFAEKGVEKVLESMSRMSEEKKTELALMISKKALILKKLFEVMRNVLSDYLTR
ncbi:MAG: hypothetical protein ACTSXW_01760 [Candidatus Baldrarchaeia archaeon]